jgi:hypothetical protein
MVKSRQAHSLRPPPTIPLRPPHHAPMAGLERIGLRVLDSHTPPGLPYPRDTRPTRLFLPGAVVGYRSWTSALVLPFSSDRASKLPLPKRLGQHGCLILRPKAERREVGQRAQLTDSPFPPWRRCRISKLDKCSCSPLLERSRPRHALSPVSCARCPTSRRSALGRRKISFAPWTSLVRLLASSPISITGISSPPSFHCLGAVRGRGHVEQAGTSQVC